ncbi:MAG: type II secretion system protein GspN [Bdellovibrionales bacterium RIFOXYD1_FULL_53_11]|nr:MAG: type II secretion system protein GspN [Bdellovibrionales bacterium RIFOXYD1_FULL_53_11]
MNMEQTAETVEGNKPRRFFKKAGWAVFAAACLLFFTLLKLPEEKIKNFILGTVNARLAPQGMSVSSEKTSVSIITGISFTMEKAVISLPPPAQPVLLDEIEISPSLLSLLTGRLGGKVWIKNGGGRMKASVSVKGGLVDASFSFKDFDAGKLGIVQSLAGLKAGAELTGKGFFEGDPSAPSGITASLDAKIMRITIDQQTFYGFSVPQLGISAIEAVISAGGGRAVIKTLTAGKPGADDDLTAKVTGEVSLGKQWSTSTLKLKTRFSLSQKILKAFILIDALLAAGKQSDGGYAFDINGPFYAPVPVPVK